MAMAAGIRIDEATEVSEELVAAIGALVGQLSRSASPPSALEVEEIVRSPACRLLLARSEADAIVGTLTLVLFRIPTGVRARIEDVVVDTAARGQGVGEELSKAAIHLAEQAGARTVDLTSRPSREAANRLYRRLGFVERESTVYRFEGPSATG
jgi:ribosomal protein S18 acetylase RimI-like enzyme